MVRSMAGRIRDFEFARAQRQRLATSRMRKFSWAPAEFLRNNWCNVSGQRRAALASSRDGSIMCAALQVVYVNGQPWIVSHQANRKLRRDPDECE